MSSIIQSLLTSLVFLPPSTCSPSHFPLTKAPISMAMLDQKNSEMLSEIEHTLEVANPKYYRGKYSKVEKSDQTDRLNEFLGSLFEQMNAY